MLDAHDGTQYLTATIGETRFFSSQDVTLPGQAPEDSNSSDCMAELAMNVRDHWKVDLGYQWDAEATQTQRAQARLQYRRDEYHVVNIAYRYQRDTVDEIDVAAAWPIADHWSAVGLYDFSMLDRKPLERFAGLEYGNCCWGLRLVYRRYVTSRDGNTDTAIAVQLVLKGLTNVGDSADRLLERGILGYDRRLTNHMRSPLLIFALATTLACVTARAQTRELSRSGELLDGIVALVNDGVVLKSELPGRDGPHRGAGCRSQGTQLPPTPVLTRQVLDRLVIEQLQLQRAEKVGIQVSDETLNQALANIAAAQQRAAGASCPALLAREGVDYTAYRRELRQQITIDQLRQRDVLQRINVTPKEVDAYLARQEGKASLREEFLLSHILIAVPANATPGADCWRRRSLVDDLYKRLQAGEDFAKLAVAYSNGQQALEGGSLGWRKGSELPSLFADVAPGLGKGQVAEPVRNASGFHLIKLDDRRGGEAIMENQTHVRHILLTTNEVLDDEQRRGRSSRPSAQRILAGEDFAAVAKAVSEDPQSAIEGGDLGWAGPGQLRAGFRGADEQAAAQRDQRAVPDPVRLAHHPGARPPRVRRHRRQAEPGSHPRHPEQQAGGRSGDLDPAPARRGFRRVPALVPRPTRHGGRYSPDCHHHR